MEAWLYGCNVGQWLYVSQWRPMVVWVAMEANGGMGHNGGQWWYGSQWRPVIELVTMEAND